MPTPEIPQVVADDKVLTGIAHTITAFVSSASSLAGAAWLRRGKNNELKSAIERLTGVIEEVKVDTATIKASMATQTDLSRGLGEVHSEINAHINAHAQGAFRG
jgi:hypothetical protein